MSKQTKIKLLDYFIIFQNKQNFSILLEKNPLTPLIIYENAYYEMEIGSHFNVKWRNYPPQTRKNPINLSILKIYFNS